MLVVLYSILRLLYKILSVNSNCVFNIRLGFVLLSSVYQCLIVVSERSVNLHYTQNTCHKLSLHADLDFSRFSSSIARDLLLLSGDVEPNPGPQGDSTNCFSIFHQNIRSIRSKMEYIKDNFSDYDILCFTEIHLTEIVNDDIIFIEGLDKMFRKDNTAHSGGFLSYVSLHLSPKRMLDLENYLPDSLWFQIKDHAQTFLICTIYRPPHYTVDFWEKVNICLEKAIDITNNIILVGDINEDQLNPINHKFRDILLINDMINKIDEPTRVTNHSRTLLDPIAITNGITVYDAGVFQTDNAISDHYGTYAHIQADFQSNNPFKRKVWNYKRADFSRLNTLIISTDWNFLHNDTVDVACESFVSTFLILARECIPSSFITIRPNDKPWYNSEIRRTSRQRDRQKHIAIRTGKLLDWNIYKRLRNKINNMKKHAKELFFNNIEYNLNDINSSNPKQYWKIVKMLVKNNTNTSKMIPPLRKKDDSLTISDIDKANLLNDYFVSISTIDESQSNLPDFILKTNYFLNDILITESEISDILSHLIVNKANGPDEISHRMLKETCSTINKPLCI